jgi:hypothetical protein
MATVFALKEQHVQLMMANYAEAFSVYIFSSITITILDFVHYSLFHLKHDVSETGLYHRLKVDPTRLDLVDRSSPSGYETETSRIYCTQLTMLHLKMETECSLRNIM